MCLLCFYISGYNYNYFINLPSTRILPFILVQVTKRECHEIKYKNSHSSLSTKLIMQLRVRVLK